MVNPGISSINRNWVVESISNPVVVSGQLAYSASLLSIVDNAYVVEIKGPAAGALGISAYVSQSHDYPGGSLSATLAPNQVVISVNQSEAGTLEPASGTLSGVVISILEHGT